MFLHHLPLSLTVLTGLAGLALLLVFHVSFFVIAICSGHRRPTDFHKRRRGRDAVFVGSAVAKRDSG